MPEGWHERPLSSVVERGRKITYGIVQPGGFVGDGVPLVRGGDYSDGWAALADIKRVRPEIDAPYKRSRLKQGDILLTIVGANTGHTAVVPDWLDGANITQTTARIAVDREIAAPTFILHWLRSEFGQDEVRKHVKGAAQPGLNLEDVERFAVVAPSLTEQRQIAAVLDLWDNAIETAERLIAAKRERLGWVRDTVLTGCVRLSGCEGNWRLVRLSQVLREHGATSTGAEPVYSVSVHRGLVDQVEHLGRSFAAASTSNYNRVKPGDIVYTKSPTGEFPLGIIKQSKVDREVIVSPLYGVFKPETRALGIVLDAYFSSAPNALRYLTPLVQKGAKNTIAVTNTQFLQGEVRLPIDSREVEALAALIGATLEDIAVSESEAALFRCQKRGLMQKLLTGEWRVPATGNAFAPGGPAADRLEAAE